MRTVLSFLIVLFFTCIPSHPQEYDSLGGWKELTVEPNLFFYLQPVDGRWWFINPAGNAFISKGVNHVSFTGDFSPALGYSPYGRTLQEKYTHANVWSKAAVENLSTWNFNTIGAWSSGAMFNRGMAYTVVLDIGANAGGNWQKGTFPDVFSEDFERSVRRTVRDECRSRKDDIHLLGYFTDNELRWGADWRSDNALLVDFLALPNGAPGNKRAFDFIRTRYGSVEKLNAAWNTELKSFDELSKLGKLPESGERVKDENAFQQIVAAAYFKTCHDAIRAEDENHLVLGCRFGGYAPEPVLRAMKDYVDLISFNTYNFKPPVETLDRIHEITGLPILLTEFSFKAMDSGLPNTRGAGKPLKTQQDRAQLFTFFVTELMKLPYMVGYHWFEYADEPKEGRFDGENSNFGLVNIHDEPWQVLTDEMTKTNAIIESVHQTGGQ